MYVLYCMSACVNSIWVEPLCLTLCRCSVWLLVGLGARGLVYHAWLGKLVAQGVLTNSEDQIPEELMSWRERLLAVAPAS